MVAKNIYVINQQPQSKIVTGSVLSPHPILSLKVCRHTPTQPVGKL